MLDKMTSSVEMSKSLVFQHIVLMQYRKVQYSKVQYSKVQYSMQLLSSREALSLGLEKREKWEKHKKTPKKNERREGSLCQMPHPTLP